MLSPSNFGQVAQLVRAVIGDSRWCVAGSNPAHAILRIAEGSGYFGTDAIFKGVSDVGFEQEAERSHCDRR